MFTLLYFRFLDARKSLHEFRIHRLGFQAGIMYICLHISLGVRICFYLFLSLSLSIPLSVYV
jgi:hypothetical protein